MTKTIFYISKYCATATKNSLGSRGWLLMKEFANRGYQSVVITSDSNNLADLPNFQSSFIKYSQEGVQVIMLKTLKYSVAKSVQRIFSWLNFEWVFLLSILNRKPSIYNFGIFMLFVISEALFIIEFASKFPCCPSSCRSCPSLP